MELSEEGYKLCPQKREEGENYHSLKSSYGLKAVLGNLSVTSLNPQYDPMKQGLSFPFDRWKNRGSQRLNGLNSHNY